MTPEPTGEGQRHRRTGRHADAPRPVRMRSVAVAAGLTAAVAIALAGRETTPDYGAVCVDRSTQERVPDDDCDDGAHGGVGWYYIGGSGRVPAVGSTATGGQFGRSGLSGSIQRGGFAPEGGSSVRSTTVKGGFGGGFRGFAS